MTLRVFMTNLKTKWFLVLILVGVYLATRLQNLTAIPVFGDEAIYLRWSQIIKNVETLRFIPLTDGKQPLYMWLVVPFLKLTNNPLVAGRLVSVFAGLGILLLLILTTSVVLNYSSQKTDQPQIFLLESLGRFFYPGLISSAIYILLPFGFFFDRMALADNLLSFFGLSALLVTLLLTKFPRLDLSLILGFVLGLAWITKSPAIYFFILSLITFILINHHWTHLFYPLISLSIGFVIYNLLRLGPQFHLIAVRNQDYIWSIADVLKHPLDPFVSHLYDIVRIYSFYLSPQFIAVASLSLFFFFKTKPKNKLITSITVLWWIIPLTANAVFAKTFTARYILFTLPPLIIIVSVSLYHIIKEKALFLLLLFLSNLVFIYQVSFRPFYAKLPPTESGYLSDWTSGWGIKPAADYLIERSRFANVIVGTEGYFGTLPDGLQIYADGVSRLTIFGVGLGFDTVPEKLIDAKNHGDEVYLLINRSRLFLPSHLLNSLIVTHRYPKPNNDELILFRL